RLDPAGLLHPRRCRYSRKRILMPGPQRYWRYLLMLLVFSYVLVLVAWLIFWVYSKLHPRWLAGLLSRDGLLILVELGLFPDVDLILRRSGKHVIQLPFVFHGRTPALGKSIDRLFLFRSRDRYDLKTRLRKQGFF